MDVCLLVHMYKSGHKLWTLYLGLVIPSKIAPHFDGCPFPFKPVSVNQDPYAYKFATALGHFFRSLAVLSQICWNHSMTCLKSSASSFPSQCTVGFCTSLHHLLGNAVCSFAGSFLQLSIRCGWTCWPLQVARCFSHSLQLHPSIELQPLICNLTAHIHAQRYWLCLAHGDISPTNILIDDNYVLVGLID